MFLKMFFLLFPVVLWANEKPQANNLSFGSYVGTLEHEKLQKQQLVRLELVTSRGMANELLIQGLLTLHFGDFKSREYITYHYENVRFDPISSRMTFDQADQDLTIVTQKFSDNEIIADVRAKSKGFVGKLILKPAEKVTPKLPLIQPIWGEYFAYCNDVQTYLQLYSLRSTMDTHRTNNPFNSYQIGGQLGEIDAKACPNPGPDESVLKCVKNTFQSGSYNFYDGRLLLMGRPKNLECEVNGDSLSCNKCEFKRISNESAKADNFAWKKSNVELLPLSTNSNSFNLISGDYFGYLYHDYDSVYQAVKLNLLTFQDTNSDEGTLKLSAVASLYFGGFDSHEVIDYRFNERTFPILAQSFVLSRPEADLDPILKIESFADGVINGTWYSQLFGRVGKFTLQKNKAPDLPMNSKLRPALSGSYESSELQLNFNVGSGSAPYNSENPFSPMEINGYFYYHSGITPRLDIVGGSYDFYTGRIGFVFDDGKRYSVGYTNLNEEGFNLKWHTKGNFMPMQPHAFQNFSLMNR